MIEISDYSTATGLRARIYSHATGSTIHLIEEEWKQLVHEIKAGIHDEVATKPHEPFIY